MYTVLCDMLSSMNICYKNSTYTEDHCLYNEYSSIKNKKIKNKNIYIYKNARQCIIGEEIMPARPLGLPGFGGHYFFSNNALEDILYSISPLLYRKSGYFSRITAFRPVGHVFVWLAHLQLIYHLDFINNRKDVKKYILLHFLISFY